MGVLQPERLASNSHSKTLIRLGFPHQWPGFNLEMFCKQFPILSTKYDLVVSDHPDVVFYSVFTPDCPAGSDSRLWPVNRNMPVLPVSDCVRVFLTGENIEPEMDQCDFAISFSRIIDHPNHLFLPLWVYGIHSSGFTPKSLIKSEDSDWEQIAAAKVRFCNFIYSRQLAFRNLIFQSLNNYKRVDAGGACQNNMRGWKVPGGDLGKLAFLKLFRFTLAVENGAWPGYATEKLVQPMLVNSIPIYMGDPLISHSFDPDSFIDYTRFSSIREMLDFVIQVDQDRSLYLKMLAAPFFRNNEVPAYARDEVVLTFFDKIFAEVLRRR